MSGAPFRLDWPEGPGVGWPRCPVCGHGFGGHAHSGYCMNCTGRCVVDQQAVVAEVRRARQTAPQPLWQVEVRRGGTGGPLIAQSLPFRDPPDDLFREAMGHVYTFNTGEVDTLVAAAVRALRSDRHVTIAVGEIRP